MTLERTTVEPMKILHKIMNGHLFSIMNDTINKFVIFKTRRVEEKLFIWSKVDGHYFTQIFTFTNGKLIKTSEDKVSRKRFGVPMFENFWNSLTNNCSPSNYTIWHSYPCRRCGRLLADPKSIILGIGPGCAIKEKEEQNTEIN